MCNNILSIRRHYIHYVESDLQQKRVKQNTDGDLIVALRFLPGIDLITTIFALIKAGLAYVPIAPNWPDGRIKMIFEDCQPIWAITNTKADPLYKAILKLEEENQGFPRIFQVSRIIYYLYHFIVWGYLFIIMISLKPLYYKERISQCNLIGISNFREMHLLMLVLAVCHRKYPISPSEI